MVTAKALKNRIPWTPVLTFPLRLKRKKKYKKWKLKWTELILALIFLLWISVSKPVIRSPKVVSDFGKNCHFAWLLLCQVNTKSSLSFSLNFASPVFSPSPAAEVGNSSCVCSSRIYWILVLFLGCGSQDVSVQEYCWQVMASVRNVVVSHSLICTLLHLRLTVLPLAFNPKHTGVLCVDILCEACSFWMV